MNKINLFLYIILKVLIALRYFGCGSFQREVADIHGISQPTASRILDKVIRSIVNLRDRYIQFPSNNDLINIQNQFMQMKGFPGVIGAIDCTHVPI